VRVVPLLFLLQNGTSLCIFMPEDFSFKTVSWKLDRELSQSWNKACFSSVVFLSLRLCQNKKLCFFSRGSFTGASHVPGVDLFGKIAWL